MIRTLIALVFCFLAAPTFAQSFSISGSFSLPQGVVAPPEGSFYSISTDPLESIPVGGGTLNSATTVMISPGSRVGNYSVTMKDHPAGAASKKLRFKCISGCSSLGIVTDAYWSLSSGAVGAVTATEFTPTQNYVVNISVPTADVFSGTVALPEGIQALGGERISVLVRASSFSNAATFRFAFVAEPNQSSWPFSIGVPILSDVGGWNLELSCDGCPEAVLPMTLFPTTRTGDPMTTQANEQFFFLKNRDNPNIQLTFLAQNEPDTNLGGLAGSMMLLLLSD